MFDTARAHFDRIGGLDDIVGVTMGKPLGEFDNAEASAARLRRALPTWPSRSAPDHGDRWRWPVRACPLASELAVPNEVVYPASKATVHYFARSAAIK